MKKIKKVLKPQQKMNDETVSRNVAAVSREPEKLYRVTPELELMASRAHGHTSPDFRTKKVEAPEVEASGSILGAVQQEEGDWNPAEYVRSDVIEDDDDDRDRAGRGGRDRRTFCGRVMSCALGPRAGTGSA
jgi:hypothetical protein